ncbi:MAG TPA: gephyrin-like molybdotransferase Glp [Terriglobales bacterium]|jgi:molybdopterin molybdotransferase
MNSESQTRILSFEDARRLVEDHATLLRPRGKELARLLDAPNRILAEPVTADRDYPPFHRATRDGYAVRSTDVAKALVSLQVAGEIQAGASPEKAAIILLPGHAISIMTGAPVPAGADAVVMIENTSLENTSRDDSEHAENAERVIIQSPVPPDANVVPAGSEAKRGARLLSPGMKLDHAALAVAASVGRAHLLVHSRPRVAVLATGNELVDIDVPPGPNQIRNSNSYSLAAQILQAGGEPILLPIAPDDPERIKELVREGLDADLLLLSGGVSAGKYDFVEPVLAELNAEFLFTGLKIQPGRPLVFGHITAHTQADEQLTSHKYFFGIPGNPVSTMVTFKLFVRPILDALAGAQPQKFQFLKAKLKSEIKTKPGLTRFLPALLSGEFENVEVELVRWQGSGDIAATALANCYIVIPPDRELIPAGELVPVMIR